jgi:hypothetical protein
MEGDVSVKLLSSSRFFPHPIRYNTRVGKTGSSVGMKTDVGQGKASPSRKANNSLVQSVQARKTLKTTNGREFVKLNQIQCEWMRIFRAR